MRRWEPLPPPSGISATAHFHVILSMFGTKDEAIEALLNEWGEEGWEVTHVYTPEGSGKVTIVAKRPLTRETIRQRSVPQYKY